MRAKLMIVCPDSESIAEVERNNPCGICKAALKKMGGEVDRKEISPTADRTSLLFLIPFQGRAQHDRSSMMKVQ
jgi:hypothetical protein